MTEMRWSRSDRQVYDAADLIGPVWRRMVQYAVRVWHFDAGAEGGKTIPVHVGLCHPFAWVLGNLQFRAWDMLPCDRRTEAWVRAAWADGSVTGGGGEAAYYDPRFFRPSLTGPLIGAYAVTLHTEAEPFGGPRTRRVLDRVLHLTEWSDGLSDAIAADGLESIGYDRGVARMCAAFLRADGAARRIQRAWRAAVRRPRQRCWLPRLICLLRCAAARESKKRGGEASASASVSVSASASVSSSASALGDLHPAAALLGM